VGGQIPNRTDGETVRDALEGAGVEDYVHVPEPESAKDDDGDAGDPRWSYLPSPPPRWLYQPTGTSPRGLAPHSLVSRLLR
jgi:hypothetical protein